MTNPILSTRMWAMHEPTLKSLAETAQAFDATDLPDYEPEDAGYELYNGVAVVQLTGPLMKYDDVYTMLLGGTSTLTTQQNLQAAIDDPNVAATLIIVDSPGGMVSGTGSLAETIANSEKPVWAYISDQCSSAAYWVVSQADQIFCNSTASVGSIGVYSVVEDTSQLYSNAGVKVTLIKAGAFKGTGVDGVPITDAQIAEEQREVDEVYSMFVDAVASGRQMTNSQATNLATGQSWIASKAKDLGLVDGIASLEQVCGMLSGEQMAQKKITSFAKAASNAVEKVASEVAEKVETVDAVVAPVVEDVKVEAPVEPAKEEAAEVAAEVKPETVTVEKSKFEALVAESIEIAKKMKEANASGFEDGVKFEKERLASLKEIAPDDAAFVLECFANGAERGSFAVAYAGKLAKELASVKASVSASNGAKAVAIGTLEQRAAKNEPKSFIRFKK